MERMETLTGIGILFVCITWCAVKVGEFYYKTHPPQQITQPKQADPKQAETKKVVNPIEGVAPWISDLVNLSITNPEKFTNDGFNWKYNKTEIWIANGVGFVEIHYREDITLTKLEKEVLYNAFTNWNKEYSVKAKQNYKTN